MIPPTARATATIATRAESAPSRTAAAAVPAAATRASRPHGRGGVLRCRRLTPNGEMTSPRDASAPTATPASVTASTTSRNCHHCGVTVVGTSRTSFEENRTNRLVGASCGTPPRVARRNA